MSWIRKMRIILRINLLYNMKNEMYSLKKPTAVFTLKMVVFNKGICENHFFKSLQKRKLILKI